MIGQGQDAPARRRADEEYERLRAATDLFMSSEVEVRDPPTDAGLQLRCAPLRPNGLGALGTGDTVPISCVSI